ncbi:Cytochrome P450 monooxygenase apf7 [Fusarium oxysporum f. sp. albedinis]|nr:Cytochrome P450 monooxygenase apf7 [Fusarium oxysporum f. sp. albedinis]
MAQSWASVVTFNCATEPLLCIQKQGPLNDDSYAYNTVHHRSTWGFWYGGVTLGGYNDAVAALDRAGTMLIKRKGSLCCYSATFLTFVCQESVMTKEGATGWFLQSIAWIQGGFLRMKYARSDWSRVRRKRQSCEREDER